jgi:superfamily II RNA helicase
MILNFLRVAECPLEYMVSSSYSEYHSQKANARDIIAASKLRSTINTLNQTIKTFYTPELKNYFNQCQQFWNIINNIQQILINHDKNSHRLLDDLLKCGRIIRIRDIYEIDIPGIVLDGSYISSGKNLNHQRIISVLVISKSTNNLLTDLDRLILKENELFFVLPIQKYQIEENKSNEKLIYQIKNINITDIIDITNEIIPNINYNEILESHWNHRMNETFDIEIDSTIGYDKALRQIIEKLKLIRQNSNNQSIALNRFNVLNDFLIKISQLSLLNNLHELNLKLENENFLINLNEIFHYLRKLNFYENKYSNMNERISSLQTNLQTSVEYESMLEVLKQLNYISNTNILKLKGQVAAIFSSGKELLLTELIYQNLIDNLTPSEIAALISSIIFQGKRFDDEINNEEEKKEITPALYQAKQQLSMLLKTKLFILYSFLF